MSEFDASLPSESTEKAVFFITGLVSHMKEQIFQVYISVRTSVLLSRL